MTQIDCLGADSDDEVCLDAALDSEESLVEEQPPGDARKTLLFRIVWPKAVPMNTPKSQVLRHVVQGVGRAQLAADCGVNHTTNTIQLDFFELTSGESQDPSLKETIRRGIERSLQEIEGTVRVEELRTE